MSQDTIRALEQIRQRLNNLSTQLSALRRDLEVNDPLPSWPSIQNSANLLSHNLASLHATLNNAQPLLKSAHAYPLPSFPGRTQEDLLGQLLRKKLQPPVEDWIDDGVKHASSIPGMDTNEKLANGATNGVHKGLSGQELEDLWNWAGPEGNRIAREVGDNEAFDDFFTLAEQEQGIENVVTGLRRKLWESDDEDEGPEDEAKVKAEEMDVDTEDTRPDIVKAAYRSGIDETKSVMPLESLLRFVSQGRMPDATATPGPALALNRPGGIR